MNRPEPIRFAPPTAVTRVADLFSTSIRDGGRVDVLGYSAEADGGGQQLVYSRSSSATIDGGTVFPGYGGTLSFSGATFNGGEGDGRYLAVDKSAASLWKFGGVTSESTHTDFFQRALNYAASVNGRLVIPGSCTIGAVSVTTTGKVEIIGTGQPTITTGSSGGLSINATQTSHTLASNVTRGDLDVVLSDASGISVGDLVLLQSSVVVGTAWNRPHRHLGSVVAIASNTITLAEPVRLNFATTDTGIAVTSYRPLKAKVSGISFHATSGRSLTLGGCRDSLVHECEFTEEGSGQQFDGLMLSACRNARAANLTFDGVRYGVQCNSSSIVHLANLVCNNSRHAVVPSFFSHAIYIDGLVGENNYAIMDSHDAFEVHYANVVTHSDRNISNMRAIGGSVRESHLQSSERDTPAAVGEFVNQQPALNSPYGKGQAQDLYADSDFIVDGLEWITDSEFGVGSARICRIANSRFWEKDGVTPNTIQVGNASTFDIANISIESSTYEQDGSGGRYAVAATDGEARVSRLGYPQRQTTAEFDGGLVGSGYSPTAGGSGYTDASGVAVTGGTGSGATVDITTDDGAVTAVTFNAIGSGYASGDVLTISGGGADATITVTLSMLVNSGYLIKPGFQGVIDTDYLKYGGILTRNIATGGDAVIGLKLSASTVSLASEGKNEHLFVKLKLLVGISHSNAGTAELKEYHFHGRVSFTDTFWSTAAFVSEDTGQANTNLTVSLVRSERVNAASGSGKFQKLFFRIASGRTNPKYCVAYEIESISQPV